MERGKLIAIGGTDASGKHTQTKILVSRLTNEKIPCEYISFPMYETPTGKIVGGPLLGKKEICESYFAEPSKIDPKVASAFYVADRCYNRQIIIDALTSGTNLVLDRYVESNMGHQGGKIKNPGDRARFFRWLEKLEYEMFELPRPDLTILLHMPYEIGIELKSKMNVQKDKVEEDINYLKNSEGAYLQLAKLYNWEKVSCAPDNTINSLRTPEDIAEEVYGIVSEFILS